MSRTSALILLGILVMLAPFSGLPVAFRSLLEVIFGACVLGIGFFMRAKESARAAAPLRAESAAPPVADPVPVEPEPLAAAAEPPHGMSTI